MAEEDALREVSTVVVMAQQPRVQRKCVKARQDVGCTSCCMHSACTGGCHFTLDVNGLTMFSRMRLVLLYSSNLFYFMRPDISAKANEP